MPLEQLAFSHLLGAARAIIDAEADIKELAARAQAPVSLLLPAPTTEHRLTRSVSQSVSKSVYTDSLGRAHHPTQGEVSIREAIEEVSAWAAETTFSTTEYISGATGKTTALIKDWKDLVTSVSDLQSLLGSLKDSRFFAAFEDTIAQYESKLAMLDHVRTCQHCPRVTIVHVS